MSTVPLACATLDGEAAGHGDLRVARSARCRPSHCSLATDPSSCTPFTAARPPPLMLSSRLPGADAGNCPTPGITQRSPGRPAPRHTRRRRSPSGSLMIRSWTGKSVPAFAPGSIRSGTGSEAQRCPAGPSEVHGRSSCPMAGSGPSLSSQARWTSGTHRSASARDAGGCGGDASTSVTMRSTPLICTSAAWVFWKDNALCRKTT